jgi:hypothetical protein
MNPLAVLTAIILGSAVAIGFGLCTVWFIAFLLKNDSSQLASELGRLPVYCSLFICLSIVAGTALVGTIKQRSWKWWAQGGMWLMVAVLFAVALNWRR